VQKKQQGVVLVLALFFVALAAMVAYWMMSGLERDTQRTRLLLRNVQAVYFADAAIMWAKQQLRDNLINRRPKQLIDACPIKLPSQTVNDYIISTTIEDAQSHFNINNLTDASSQEDFKRLVAGVSPGISDSQVQEIIRAVIDWITPNTQENEYQQYYLHLSPPYRAAHQAMISVSELQLVKGITPTLFSQLKPYVTALPGKTKINIQTAPALVLASLSPSMTIATGQSIEAYRQNNPFVSEDDFLKSDIIKNHPISEEDLKEKITVKSSYFLVKTEVAIETQWLVLYTLMERKESHGQVAINTVWQSKNIEG
jgi:general secretion pathway protein K